MASFECCWPSSDGDDWSPPLQAIDAQEAAERYAAQQCRNESDCYDDFERGQNVNVRLGGSELALTFRVSCEFEPTFRACRVSEPG
jgi:hypothetical protein